VGAIAVTMVLGAMLAAAGTAHALPLLEASINEGGKVGSYAEAGGVYTVQASGGDIWGNDDGFYFVYQEFDAADTIDFYAYVGSPTGFTAVEGGINDWAKAGIMIRQSLDQKSQNACTVIAHKDGNGMNPQIRPAYDVGTKGTNDTGSRVAHDTPVWLRLTYDGINQFESYYNIIDPGGAAPNPANWVKFSNDGTMVMNGGSELTGTIMVGLALTAHATGNLTQIEFSDVHGFEFWLYDLTSVAADYWDLDTTWAGVVPPAPTVPDADTEVTVDGETVTVRAENPPGTPLTNVAGSLDITAGGVVVDTGATLSVVDMTTVDAAAALTIDGTLDTGRFNTAAALTIDGTLNAGSLITAAALTVNGAVDADSISTDSLLTVNGTVDAGSLTTSAALTVDGTLNAGSISNTDVAALLTVNGTVDADSLTTVGALAVNGTVDADSISNTALTTLGAAGLLKAGGGEIQAVTTLGNATVEVNAAGTLTATDLNLAAGSIFTKAGDGKLSFTSGASNTIVPGDTVKVGAGELFMQCASNPLGGGNLVLDGGTYSPEGTPVVLTGTPGHLNMSGFMNPTDHVNNLDFNNDGDPGILDDVAVGTADFTGLLDINGDGAFRALIPGITQNDNYQTLFEGGFKTTGAGDYSFRFRNRDDAVVLYIDLDKDGVFEHAGDLGTERILGPNDGQALVNLDAATEYRIAFGHAEGTGGSRIRAQFNTPAGGEVPVEADIDLQNPDHAQFFLDTRMVPDIIDMRDSPVAVTATSTLNAITHYSALFGPLTIDPDCTLTTQGAPDGITFTDGLGGTDTGAVTITGAGAVGFDAVCDTNIGALNAGAHVVTVTKSGAGDLVLDQATATSTLAAGSLIDVQGGKLVGVYDAVGAANPFGPAGLKIGTAEVVLDVSDHSAQTFDNAIEVDGNATLTAGLTDGVETITVGSAGNPITLTSGNLTARGALGHTIKLDGAVNGADTGSLTGGGGTVQVNRTSSVMQLIAADGTMEINAPLTTTGGYGINNVMTERIYDPAHDPDNIVNMLAQTPAAQTDAFDLQLHFPNDAAFDAEVARLGGGTFDNGNFSACWIGEFKPTESGDWQFGFNGEDDNAAIWIDLDRDGAFESGDGERVFERGCCGGGLSGEIALSDVGDAYMMAYAMNDTGGGGNFSNAYFLKPDDTRIEVWPGDPSNAGYWYGTSVSMVNVTGATLEVNADLVTSLVKVDAGAMNLNPGNSLTLDDFQVTGGALDLKAGSTVNFAVGGTVNQSGGTMTTNHNLGDPTATWNISGGTYNSGGDITAATVNVSGSGTLEANADVTTSQVQVGGGAMNLNNGTTLTLDAFQVTGGALDLKTGSTVNLAVGGTVDQSGGAMTTNQAFGDSTAEWNISGGAYNSGGDVTARHVNVTGGGTFTSDAAINAARINVDGGHLVINQPAAAIGDEILNAIEHRGFHINNDNLMDIHNNGGLMAETPWGTAILTDGPGGRGLDFDDDNDFINTGAIGRADNYMNLFLGTLHVTTAGDYSFRNAGDDDRGAFWLDLDQDGVFESTQSGLGSNRGEQLSYEDGGTKTVNLAIGDYLYAGMHREGGGGSRIDLRINGPTLAGEEIIKPTDPDQDGLWSIVIGAEVRVANGTIDANSTVAADRLIIDGGGIYNANALGCMGNVGARIDVNAGGTLNANLLNVLDGLTPTVAGTLAVTVDGGAKGADLSNILPGGYVNITFPQTSEANFPNVTLAGGTALGGDLTNADYNDWDDADPKNVTLAVNAVLAATSAPATLPIRDEVLAQTGGACTLYEGIIAVTNATTYNWGDDGVASIFKGGAIGEWTDAGNFEATVNDISTTDTGIEILMNGDMTVNSETTLDTDNGGRGAEFRGPGQLLIASPVDTPGAGKTITRTGLFDPVDGSGQDTTGDYIVRLEDGALSAQTLKVTKGLISIRHADAVPWDSTVEVGEHATLKIRNDADGKKPNSGNFNIAPGGVLLINETGHLSNALVNLDPDAYIYLDGNISVNSADSSAMPGEKGFDNVNIIITADQFTDGLFLGDGRMLTTPSRQGQGTHATNTVIQKSLSADPTGSYVRFANAVYGNGDLTINSAVQLSEVDLYINDEPGVYYSLPQHDNTLQREYVEMDGRVNIDNQLLQCANIEVFNGFLRLGNSGDFNIEMDPGGALRIHEGGAVELQAQRPLIRDKTALGTLFPGGIFVDNGTGQPDPSYFRFHTDPAGEDYLQAITFTGTGAGRAYFRMDETGDNQTNHFKNITLHDGAYWWLGRNDMNTDQLRMDLTIDGTVRITGDDFAIESITAAAPSTLLLGDPAGTSWEYDIDAQLRGTPSANATLVLDQRECRLDVFNDLGASKVVTHTGGRYVDGEDLKVRLYYGRDHTIDEDGDTVLDYEAWGAGSEIEISGCGRIEVWTNRAGGSAPSNENVYMGRVHVMDSDPALALPWPFDAILMAKNGGGSWNGSDPTIGRFAFVDVDGGPDGQPDLDVNGAPAGGGVLIDPNAGLIMDRDNQLNIDVAVPTIDADGADDIPGNEDDEVRPVISSYDHDQWLTNVYSLEPGGDLEELEIVGHPENFNTQRRYTLDGTVNGALILWNTGDHLDLDAGTDLGGHGGTNSQPGEVRNIHAAGGRIELHTDPGDGTISSYVAGEGVGGRNEKVYIFYGEQEGQDEDGDGNLLLEQWGEGTTIKISGGGRIEHRVRRVTGNVNEFLGTVRVMDDVEITNEWDANLRSQNAGGPNSQNDAFSIYSDVRVDPTATLNLQRDNVVVVDLNVEDGGGGAVGPQDGDRTFIRNITNISGVAGNQTITLGPGRNGDRTLRMIGVLDGDPGDDDDSNLEVFWTANTNLILEGANTVGGQYADTSYVLPGFRFAGHGEKLTVLAGRAEILENGTGDIGDGVISLQGAGGGGELRLLYGKGEDPADLIGDNGWGGGAGAFVTEAWYNDMVRLYVDEDEDAGETNVNKFEGTIFIKGDGDPGTLDGRLRAERGDNRAGMGLAHFADIRPDLDSQTQLERSNETRIRADFNLVNGNAEVNVYQGIFAQITANSDDDDVLTIDRTGGQNATLDLTMLDKADMDIDPQTNDVIRINGLHLNGNTLSFKRGRTAEVWFDCNTDPGAGLIDIVGYDTDPTPEVATWTGGGLEFRTGREGGDAIEAATQIQVAHDRLLSGYVAQKYVQAVQNFAADVKIINDGTDRDAQLRTRTSDDGPIHEGWTPGQVKFSSLTMADGAKVELTKQDWGGLPSQQLYLENVHLLGDAEIYQSASLSGMFIGNTDGAFTLTVGGGQPIYLTGTLAADTRVTGQAVVQPSATLTGPVEVDGGVCTLMPGVTAGTFTVKADGVLAISDAAFAGATTVEANGGVALAADLNWSNNVNDARILIAKENYGGTITLDNPNTVIGGTWTDRASMTQPLVLTDAVTTITFGGVAGADKTLTLAGGVLHDTTPGDNPVAVNFEQDVRITGASSHTGVNTIGDAITPVACTVYAMDPTALGGGGGGGASVIINDTAELRILANNFDSDPIEVNGLLDVRAANVDSDVKFSGGIIRAAGNTDVKGAITEDDNITIENGPHGTGTVKFSDALGVALADNRTWTINSGTAEFTGPVTGAVTLTKAGPGTLQLDGGVGGTTSLILGTSPGGLTVIGAGGTVGAADSVTINAEAAYGVKKVDHGYAEVDMTNSFGCIALGANSAATLTMLNPDMTLGACDDVAFTGTIEPDSYTYKLGGGGATLTIADGVLSDYDDGMGGGPQITNVQIGRSAPAADDITHAGMVQVNGHQIVTGAVDIYGAAGVQDHDTFWATAPAGEAASVVNVQPGGTLDLGGTILANVQGAPNTTLVLVEQAGGTGGGVARNGGTITQADSWLLFGVFRDCVYGGGGEASDGNETKLEDGAADTGGNCLVKVGTNQVRLLAPTDQEPDGDVDEDDLLNNYTVETRVEAGRLVVEDVRSLGQAILFTVQGDGVAEFEAGGTLPYSAAMALDGNARLEVVAGTLVAGGLTASGNVTIAGNLDIGEAVVGGAGVATLESGTLTAQYGDTSARFVAGEGSTLNFTTAANGSGIGSLMPNSLLTFGDADPAAAAVDANVGGGQALKFEAEAGGWSNGTTRVYTINVVNSGDPLAAASEIDLTSGDGIRSASYTDDADIGYRPVAHIQKTGEGILRTAGDTFNAGSPTVTRKLAWDIVGGTLEATAGDGQGLGPDAYAWVMNEKRPTIANQHLESIDVRDGATLAWGGTHGFLEADKYGGLPAGEGDGFNDDEFRMYDGSTLQGSNLQLGFYQTFAAPNAGTDTYLCYPTLVGTSPVNVTFTGSINFDSGIALDNADPVNVTTAGDIRFSNTLPDAVGVDVINNLVIQSGTTTIYNNHLAMQTTDIQGGGTLAFDPAVGPQITYNGTVSGTAGTLAAVGGSTNVPGGGAPISIATLSVTDSTLVIDQPVTTTGYSAFIANQLAYDFYQGAGANNLPNIDDGVINAHNGGLFDLTPTSSSVKTDEIWEGDHGSNYCQMWSGFFKPPQDGDYEFWVHGDDYELLWIDENLNGDFEANGTEDVSRNVEGEEGWNTPHTETINLDAGEYYPFALTSREGSGGAFCRITIKEPGGDAVRIDPSVQTDWWYRGLVLPDATMVSGGTLEINALLTTGNATVTGGGVLDADTLTVANLVTIGDATSDGTLTAGATTATDFNLVNGTADLASLAASGTVNVGAGTTAGALTAGVTTAGDFNVVNGTANLASLAASGAVGIGNDTTAGALTAGATTANAFSLTNGTADLASLTGTGATPTATVAADTTLTVTGATGMTAMNDLTVLGTADVQTGPADAVTTTVGQGAPIVPPGGSAIPGSLTAVGATGQDLDIASGTADYGAGAVNMSGTITIGSAHRDPAYEGDYVGSVMADNPLLYYRFEEADNTLPALDTAGGDHNGTYRNQATPVELAAGTAPMDGMLGKAVEFDGADDSVAVDHTIVMGNHLSIESWFNSEDLGGWDCIINRDDWPTGGTHWQFNGRDIQFAVNGGTGDRKFAYAFNDNQWYHVVVTYDRTVSDGELKLYVDGDLQQTISNVGASKDPSIAPGDIGAWKGNDREWDGYMDEFAIYDSILSEERVAAHYAGQSLIDPGCQPAPGAFVGGATTANTVNLRNGSAVLASLRGMGTDPSTTVGAGTTMNVASDIRGMSNITVGGILTTGAGVNVTDELTVEPGGTFDLRDGNLVVNYGAGANPFDDLAALVKEGYNNIDTGPPVGFPNVWEGTGITTILGTYAENDQWTTGLAIIDNDDPLRDPGGGLPPMVGGKESLGDVPLPGDFKSVLIGYTWVGDANFDGIINSADFDLIERAWLQIKAHPEDPPDGGFRYAVGDFNFDGMINSADYDLIERTWLIAGSTPIGGIGGIGGPVPTPEPATLVLLGLGAAAALARKRRSR